jgi:hypothetical protein
MKQLLRLTAGALLLGATLTGCVQTIALDPAENAIDPGCAEIVVHAPVEVATFAIRETNAQGTVAWGTPSSVILRCGVPEPDPTSTLQCVRVGTVDWLRDDADDPNFVFTTYGRSPATEVIIDSNSASAIAALTDLESAVALTEKTSECIDVDDALAPIPTATPAP